MKGMVISMPKEKLVICGAGGHAKVIIDILKLNAQYEVVGCTDNNLDRLNQRVLGVEILGDDSILLELYSKGITNAFVALGDNRIRLKVANNLINVGFKIINVISTFAYVSDSVKLGQGIAIMPGAVINADSIIGNFSIINTNASVDHDCKVADYCHIAPGCNISGYAEVGVGTFLGTGCKVRDKVKIGEWCTIGVGSAVVKDIASYFLAYGVPATMIKRDNQ